MAVVYDNAAYYIDEATDLRAKIQRIEEVINALELMALTSAGKGNINEYWLNDGQIQVRTSYRSHAEISSSITAFERIKQRYINQLNGRGMRLVDSKNFRRGR